MGTYTSGLLRDQVIAFELVEHTSGDAVLTRTTASITRASHWLPASVPFLDSCRAGAFEAALPPQRRRSRGGRETPMIDPSETSTTEHAPPAKTPRSRRAVLTGAIGGLAALAAAAAARPSRALGDDGDNLVIGQENTATEFTRLTLATEEPGSAAFIGRTDTGVGLRGRSVTGQGVQGFSSSSAGVQGFSDTDAGVNGFGGPFGVWATGDPYGGFFVGAVHSTQYYELEEISAPGAPSADQARLFVRANAAGRSQLCVQFGTGGVKVLATEG